MGEIENTLTIPPELDLSSFQIDTAQLIATIERGHDGPGHRR